MANDYNFGIKISADGAQQSVRQIAGVEAELRKTQQATKDAEAAAKGLGDAYDLDENGIRAVAGALQQLGTDTERAKGEAEGLSSVVTGFVERVGQRGFDLLIASVQQLGQAFADVIVRAGEQAAAFDDARAAASTLTDDTDTLIANLEQAQAGLNNQVGTTDLLAASYDVLSSGFTDAADAAEVTEQAARGAIAGFSDTATVADALTSILNAYGKEAGDAAQVVDQLVKTQDLGKITIDQYAQGVGRAASIAAQAGVSFETFSGAVATATAAGVPAESAISGVRQAIVNLLKPTDEGQKLLEKYGISSGAAALKTQDLDGVLRQLEDATPEELGKIFSDVDALATVATLAGDNVDSFVASIEGIDGAVGTADVAIGKITDTLNGQRRALEVSIQEGLLDFGQALEPAFEGILTLINDVFAAARESSDGFDPLIEAGERLQTVLEGNPEIAERLGEAFANLADQGIGALAGFVDAVTAFVSDQDNIDQYAQSIEALGGAITGIGNTIEFIIALVDGILQLRAAAADLPVIGGIVERLLQPFGQFALMRDLVQGLGNAFVNLRDTVINSVQGTVDAVGEAFPALEPLLNQIERILSGLGQNPDTQAFSGIADGAKGASDALKGAADGIENLQGVAEQAANQPKPDLPAPTPEDTAEAETAYERIANANRRALQQIAIDNANLRADRLEAGASAEEIEGIEANALKRRIDANRQYLEQLRALEAQGGQNAEEAKKTADAIAQVEGQLAQDRVSLAQGVVEAEKKAEQERIKAAEEAAKKVTDALKEEREEQKRTAEERFNSQQDARQETFDQQQEGRQEAFRKKQEAAAEAFQDRQQDDAEAFQDQQDADAEAFQQRQQDAAKVFQRQQQAEAEAFQKRLDEERERGNREFDALASEVERRVALANASSSEERKQLREQFREEDEQRQQRNQIERQVLGQRGSVLGQAGQRGELELSPLEQARADFEAGLEERQRAFQEEQRLAEEEFQAFQEEDARLFREEQELAADEFRELQELESDKFRAGQELAQAKFNQAERDLEEAFEEQQRQRENAFKTEQRRLDEANARRIAAILRAAQAGRAPQARRLGGPVQPGQPYLVGEEGPELIFPSRAGYVATARETAAMMTAAMPAVHGVGGVGAGRVETLLENLLKEVRRGRAVNPGPTTYNLTTETPQVDLRQLELDRMRDLLRLRGIP